MISTCHYDSPLGGILLAADEIGLTGYAGGLDKKIALLKLENIDLTAGGFSSIIYT